MLSWIKMTLFSPNAYHQSGKGDKNAKCSHAWDEFITQDGDEAT
jgi:hypothetical protein